jgi:hypothetical protein
MLTSRQIRELLARNPQNLYYMVSTILDLSEVRSEHRGCWLQFEVFVEKHVTGWSWDISHRDFVDWKGVPARNPRTKYFAHHDGVAYNKRLFKYAYNLGYLAEASICAAALRELKLWELPVENHVPVRR